MSFLSGLTPLEVIALAALSAFGALCVFGAIGATVAYLATRERAPARRTAPAVPRPQPAAPVLGLSTRIGATA
ncbi:MAG: hypothetical protein FJ304_10605 [Planctomycetes bacterium]|nr:hypothetical protein [Planctomycetota bacterium]